MKKMLYRSIEQDNHHAMYQLGDYYEKIEKSEELMKKYYLMAAEKGNKKAKESLLCYYNDILKNNKK